jgi:raffinose/stachyose/melibiose transport system permease protein
MTREASVARRPRTVREGGSLGRRRAWRGWLFALPLVAINALVILAPSIQAGWYSFTDWNGIGPAEFVGFDNYTRMASDPDFLNALRHNLWWTLGFLTVPMAMGIGGAFVLSRVRRGQLLFRIAYLIPYIVASVVNASIWQTLLAPDNAFGELFDVNFLGDPSLALVSVAFVQNWAWWGFLTVIYLAAMRGVDPTLYEAARLDGSGARQEFWYITLPSIRPTLVFLALMTVIWSFLVFDYIYILTEGGPAGSTDVLGTLLYRTAFSDLEAGYAASMGVVLALFSSVWVGAYLALRRWGRWEL